MAPPQKEPGLRVRLAFYDKNLVLLAQKIPPRHLSIIVEIACREYLHNQSNHMLINTILTRVGSDLTVKTLVNQSNSGEGKSLEQKEASPSKAKENQKTQEESGTSNLKDMFDGALGDFAG